MEEGRTQIGALRALVRVWWQSFKSTTSKMILGASLLGHGLWANTLEQQVWSCVDSHYFHVMGAQVGCLESLGNPSQVLQILKERLLQSSAVKNDFQFEVLQKLYGRMWLTHGGKYRPDQGLAFLSDPQKPTVLKGAIALGLINEVGSYHGSAFLEGLHHQDRLRYVLLTMYYVPALYRSLWAKRVLFVPGAMDLAQLIEILFFSPQLSQNEIIEETLEYGVLPEDVVIDPMREDPDYLNALAHFFVTTLFRLQGADPFTLEILFSESEVIKKMATATVLAHLGGLSTQARLIYFRRFPANDKIRLILNAISLLDNEQWDALYPFLFKVLGPAQMAPFLERWLQEQQLDPKSLGRVAELRYSILWAQTDMKFLKQVEVDFIFGNETIKNAAAQMLARHGHSRSHLMNLFFDTTHFGYPEALLLLTVERVLVEQQEAFGKTLADSFIDAQSARLWLEYLTPKVRSLRAKETLYIAMAHLEVRIGGVRRLRKILLESSRGSSYEVYRDTYLKYLESPLHRTARTVNKCILKLRRAAASLVF